MSVISLRLNENEEKLLREVAEFEGMGLSSYLKKIIFERLEDEYDLKIANEAYEKHMKNGAKTIKFDDLIKELGVEL